MSIRHLLFPLVWLLYGREPMAERGQYLFPVRFETSGEDSLTIFFGRFEGFSYGKAVFTANPPTLHMSRKDGVVIDLDFVVDDSAILEIRKGGILTLYRSGESPFLLFRIQTLYAIQLMAVYHKWPESVKKRFRIQRSA